MQTHGAVSLAICVSLVCVYAFETKKRLPNDANERTKISFSSNTLVRNRSDLSHTKSECGKHGNRTRKRLEEVKSERRAGKQVRLVLVAHTGCVADREVPLTR